MNKKIGNDNKTAFFHLILVDFFAAIQFVVLPLLFKNTNGFDSKWMLESYLVSFFLAFFAFLIFSDISESGEKSKKLSSQGLIFFLLGNLFLLFFKDANRIILGNVFSGLGFGMVFLGQMGIIWHTDQRKSIDRLLILTLTFLLGFLSGPYVIEFISGSNLDKFDVTFLFGSVVSFLALVSHNIKSRQEGGESAAFSKNFVVTAVFAIRAFFGIKSGDSAVSGSGKVALTVFKRIIYSIADYYLAIFSAVIVGFMKYWNYGFFEIFFVTWVYDLFVAIAFVVLAEKTGQDVTLGEAYRKGSDVVMERSKKAGYIVFFWVFVKAIIWDGPEHIVIFFKKELRTYFRMGMTIVLLTIVQAIFWTWAYSLGYDSIFELLKNYF